MEKYYTKESAYREKFYRVPMVFTTNPDYIKMNDSTKLAYAILLQRQELSIKNGWYDEEGRIYFVYSMEDLQKVLGVAKQKANNIKKELIKNNLLESDKRGQGRVDRLYLLRPIVTEDDIYKIDEAETLDTVEKYENHPSKSMEIIPLEVSKSSPSKKELNKTDNNKTKDNKDLDLSDIEIPKRLKSFIEASPKHIDQGQGRFNIYEIERFYLKSKNTLIKDDLSINEYQFLSPSEFCVVVEKAMKEVKGKIENTYGLIQNYVSKKLSYKRQDYFESLETEQAGNNDVSIEFDGLLNAVDRIHNKPIDHDKEASMEAWRF